MPPKSRVQKNKESAPKTNIEEEQFIYEVFGTPNYKVDVDGIGPVIARIDSGCNACAIRRDVLTDSIASKMGPVKSSVKNVDDSEDQCLGLVKLRVKCLGKSVEVDFFVHDELSSPMKLGTSWMRKSCAILQSDGLRLRVDFSGQKVKKACRTKVLCELPYVSVDVDEIGPMRALADTGCTSTMIRKDMLTEHQMSEVIPNQNMRIGLANGKQRQGLIIGCVDLNVTYQGMTTFIEKASVVSEMTHKLLLGMDWIHKTRVKIESDGSQITVKKAAMS